MKRKKEEVRRSSSSTHLLLPEHPQQYLVERVQTPSRDRRPLEDDHERQIDVEFLVERRVETHRRVVDEDPGEGI